MSQKSGPVKLSSERIVKDMPSDPQAIFGRGENPHRSGWPSRRAQYCGAVPTRRDCRELVLHLVEGVSGQTIAFKTKAFCESRVPQPRFLCEGSEVLIEIFGVLGFMEVLRKRPNRGIED